MLQASEKDLSLILQKDTTYQQLLASCQEAEERFLAVMERMSSEDRSAVERYITLCEEMDHRKLMLALERMR